MRPDCGIWNCDWPKQYFVIASFASVFFKDHTRKTFNANDNQMLKDWGQQNQCRQCGQCNRWKQWSNQSTLCGGTTSYGIFICSRRITNKWPIWNSNDDFEFVQSLNEIGICVPKLILFDSGLIIIYPCIKLILSDGDTNSTFNADVDINFEFGLHLVVFVRTVGTVIILPLWTLVIIQQTQSHAKLLLILLYRINVINIWRLSILWWINSVTQVQPAWQVQSFAYYVLSNIN